MSRVFAKCITFHDFGTPEDVLRVEDKMIQPPSTGEILVRMKMRPINPSDLIPIKEPIHTVFLYRAFLATKVLEL